MQLVSSASFSYRNMLICWWKESYGGHYGPVFAEYIEAHNTRAGAQTTKISLETLTIINGWMNPIIQVGYHDPSEELMKALNKDDLVCRVLQLHSIYSLLCRVSSLTKLREAGLSREHI